MMHKESENRRHFDTNPSFGPRQRVATLVGGAAVLLLLIAAFVVDARDLSPADPPAVMAAPAAALSIARLPRETTTGEELTAGLAQPDETGTTVQ